MEQVLFPFGYGLSYTAYEYSNLRVNKNKLDANDTLEIKLDVTNTGNMAGSEIVQVYVSRILTGKQRDNKPIRQLKGYQKVRLDAGETQTITIEIQVSDISFWSNFKKKFVVEPASYKLEIGASSADIRQETVIELYGEWDADLCSVYVLADKYCYHIGEEGCIKASAALEDATHLNMDEYQPVFASSDESVAVVDERGHVKAVGCGVCELSATVTYKEKSITAVTAAAVRSN